MAKKIYSERHRFEVEEAVKHYYFNKADPGLLKRAIMKDVENKMNDLGSRGPRFFSLLFYELARYGLDKMQFHPRLPEKDFMDIINDFKTRWDEDAELRGSHALAEYL